MTPRTVSKTPHLAAAAAKARSCGWPRPPWPVLATEEDLQIRRPKLRWVTRPEGRPSVGVRLPLHQTTSVYHHRPRPQPNGALSTSPSPLKAAGMTSLARTSRRGESASSSACIPWQWKQRWPNSSRASQWSAGYKLSAETNFITRFFTLKTSCLPALSLCVSVCSTVACWFSRSGNTSGTLTWSRTTRFDSATEYGVPGTSNVGLLHTSPHSCLPPSLHALCSSWGHSVNNLSSS